MYVGLGMRLVYVHVNMIFASYPADVEFDELCFDFGIELDEVVSGNSMSFPYLSFPTAWV